MRKKRPSPIRRNPKEIARVLKEFRQSGLPQRQFAQDLGIGLSTLQKWIREAKRPALKKPRFVEVEIPKNSVQPSSISGYEISLPTGVQLRLPRHFDPEELNSLLQLAKNL